MDTIDGMGSGSRLLVRKTGWCSFRRLEWAGDEGTISLRHEALV